MTNEEVLEIIEQAAKDRVTYLNLCNEDLTALPKKIGNLNNLTELHLNYNQLTVLPKEIGNLTHLTALYLDNTASRIRESHQSDTATPRLQSIDFTTT